MNPTQKVGAGGCGDTVTSDDGGEVTRVYIIHRHTSEPEHRKARRVVKSPSAARKTTDQKSNYSSESRWPSIMIMIVQVY